ncbi:hypothetical protein H5J25_03695 [Sphingomonas aliaeris]|uniref:Uncharacterized protein n=1 Tax=Sphingomonas aliaeris TaxID=2759526 RepID=A0A974NVL7_9SPHN|nr:hypothetical protein [Sphingomonas aliaeris]QQV77869.1 hypothetical protein H5J25_03695 [Sphingomonas aliaeris]
MLRDREVIRHSLPTGYVNEAPTTILLSLYLSTAALSEAVVASALEADGYPRATKRWFTVIVTDGLARRKDGKIELTGAGLELVEQILAQLGVE